jgi:hypothetical protein
MRAGNGSRMSRRRGKVMAVMQRGLIALGVLIACTDTRAPASRTLPALSDAKRSGSLADGFLREQSGLVRSSSDASVFWSHNDSGNQPQLFAVDSTGASRGRWTVTGATNNDWEAIAVGPCESGACIYLADVGDNGARRKTVSIWRIREPALPMATERTVGDATGLSTDSATRIRVRYPDGAHDVEAVWVSPDTSIWLLTKRPHRNAGGQFRRALLFRIPPSASHDSMPVLAQLVDSLPIVPLGDDSDTWVTDASFSADGSGGARVAVRTYQEVVVFSADSLTGRPDSVVARCSLRRLHERSGEAVAWMANGRLLLGNEGRGSRLWTGRC